jgi:serine/threonine-protein kinase RsbW
MPFTNLPTRQLQFSSTHQNAREVEALILAECQQNGFSEEDCFGVHMALHEALVNAVKHGNKLDSTKQVRVSYHVDPRLFHVEIQDEGSGFNPATLADPTAEENLEALSGRGILLMRAYMDDVSFNPAGNIVTMSKRPSGA